MMSGAANVSEAPETPDEIETVLVVDDEVLIRMAIADYLRDCGYHVVEAANGDEAISVLTAAECEVDLILSDVQMPGSVDGFALARWVRQNKPGLEIILTSGYAGAARESMELCDEKDLVAKPYEFDRLLDRIKQSLARRARGV
jgi:CheY-like chemotaxis protein